MDNDMLESLAEIKLKLGLNMSEIFESYIEANKLANQVCEVPVSRWELMNQLLMNDNLSRSQAIFVAWITAQLLTEAGVETPLM